MVTPVDASMLFLGLDDVWVGSEEWCTMCAVTRTLGALPAIVSRCRVLPRVLEVLAIEQRALVQGLRLTSRRHQGGTRRDFKNVLEFISRRGVPRTDEIDNRGKNDGMACQERPVRYDRWQNLVASQLESRCLERKKVDSQRIQAHLCARQAATQVQH